MLDVFFHAIRFFQILCGGLTCLLIWRLGLRLFTPAIAVSAAFAAAVYGPLIFFDGEVLPATFGTFLGLTGLILMLHAIERPAPLRFFIAGVVFGLAALTIATILTFAAAAAIFIWTRRKTRHIPAIQRLREPGFFLIGVALTIAPVTVRNIVVGEDRVLISSNAGVNFYVGNSGDYDEKVNIRPGWEWDELLERPRLEHGITKASKKSTFFFAKAWEYMSSEPWEYAVLLARKMLLFWQGDEIGRNQGIYFWRNYSAVLSATLWKRLGLAFPFGIVAPLALLGCALAIRRQGFSLPLLFIAAYGLSVVAFFISSRYRIPLIP